MSFAIKNSVTERRHLYMDYALYFDTLSDEEILELAKLDNSCFKQNSPFDTQLRQYVLEKLPIVEQRLLNTIIEIDILERNTENNNENKRRDTL